MWDIMFQEQNLVFRVLLPNFSQGPDVVPNGILGVFGPSVNNNNDSLTQQRLVLPSLDSNFGVPDNDVNLLSELILFIILAQPKIELSWKNIRNSIFKNTNAQMQIDSILDIILQNLQERKNEKVGVFATFD